MTVGNDVTGLEAFVQALSLQIGCAVSRFGGDGVSAYIKDTQRLTQRTTTLITSTYALTLLLTSKRFVHLPPPTPPLSPSLSLSRQVTKQLLRADGGFASILQFQLS